MDQISFVIITKNEESSLGRCLRSLPKDSETIVLDSESSDRTQQIAESFGAKFYTRTFTNYSEQKNAAIALATKPWIFSIDADEELRPELLNQLEDIIKHPPVQSSLFRIRRYLIFMGHRMRFGKSSDQPIRFGKKEDMHFNGLVHESLSVHPDTVVVTLSEGGILHHSYKDLTDYFEKFNQYTSKIAQNNDQNNRKISFLRVVLRPWTEFFIRYFIRLGFLDGYPGYCYALISSFYTFVKHAKLLELKHENK